MIRTDAWGAVKGLENLGEVQEQTGKAIRDAIQLMSEIKGSRELVEDVGIVMKPLLSPSGIQIMALNLPQIFYCLSGCAFALHDPVALDSMLPNPFGGAPIPSKLTIEMVEP